VISGFFPFQPGQPEIKIFYKDLSAIFIESSDNSSPQEGKGSTNLSLKPDENYYFPANIFFKKRKHESIFIIHKILTKNKEILQMTTTILI